MTEAKRDPSPRSLRRFVGTWMVALASLAVASLVWVVDPGQQAVLVAWSVVGVSVLGVVRHLTSHSTERPMRVVIPPDRRFEEALRQWWVFLVPYTAGQLGVLTLTGHPSTWVRTAALAAAGSTGIGLVALISRWLGKRRRRLSSS